MQQKLNEHIIYLQNEVRKRDDMLDDNENSDSDFDLDCTNSVISGSDIPKKVSSVSSKDDDKNTDFGQSGSL